MPAAKTSSARRSDRYVRCDDFAARIDGVELAPDVWAVFARLSRPHTAAEIAAGLKIDVEAAQAALRRLVRRKLVRKHVLAWRDYAASAEPTQPDAPDTNAVAVSSARSAPPFHVLKEVAATEALHADAARPPGVFLRIGPPVSAAPVETAAVSLRIAARDAAARPARPDEGGLKLKPVLDAIGAKAGGGVAGQLLVYRVFLQIPTDLMRAAGLHSLSLVDDSYTLRHPELRATLAETARRHAGVDIEALAAAV